MMPELKQVFTINIEKSKDDGEQTKFQHFDMSIDGKYLAVRKAVRSSPIIYDIDRGVSIINLRDFAISPTKIIEQVFTKSWFSLVTRLHGALTVFFETSLPGGKIFFRPKATEEPDIAYVMKDGKGISIYQFSDNAYKKTGHLKYRDKSECRRGAAGWSPNGRFFVSGSYAGQGGPGARRLSVWNIADQRLIYRPLFNSLMENSKVTWSSCSNYFLIDSPRELFLFDIANESQHNIKEFLDNENIFSIKSTSWHPSKPLLSLACQTKLVVIDVTCKSTVFICNDIRERNIDITQEIKSYYAEKGTTMDFERYSSSDVAFSYCGDYLASSDYWGNIVIRNTSDFSIVKTYSVNCRPGGYRSRLYWMTNSPNNVLIIVTLDEYGNEQAFFVNVTSNDMPRLIEASRLEDSVVVKNNRVALMHGDTINIYQYS